MPKKTNEEIKKSKQFFKKLEDKMKRFKRDNKTSKYSSTFKITMDKYV